MSQPPSRIARAWLAALACALALFAVGMVVGPGEISASTVARVLVGLETGEVGSVHAVILDLRLPRILLAAVVGSGLAVAGVVTQGLFRNGLAEPSVLGVNTGAACAAVLGFLLGIDRLGLWVLPLWAALGAAAFLFLLLALAGRGSQMTTLLLCGVALGSFGGALITLMLTVRVEDWNLGVKVMTWLMGTFDGRSWPHLTWAIPPTIVGLGLAFWLRRDLDVLHLGADTAESLGVDLRKTRLLAVSAVAILVGGATALVGVIGFVGLLVPHVSRMLVGPTHRALLPFSAVAGALLLVAVDTASRSMTSAMVPPGVITSLLGAPFFLWLLRRRDPVHG